MLRSAAVLVVFGLLLLPIGLQPVQASAGQPNQAGLVIRFDDGRLVTRCIDFQGDSIAGSELIARSGLSVNIDSSRGLGITICKIEGLGCNYPVDACFCQCMGGGQCRYWNYYYRDPGQADWVYSPLGALLRKAQPGSVEAWVWGDGHTPPDSALTFDTICSPATPTPAPTLAPTPQAISTAGEPSAPRSATGEANPAVTALPSQVPPLASAAASPTSAPAEPPAPLTDLSIYWPMGILLLLLIGVASYMRLGRK